MRERMLFSDYLPVVVRRLRCAGYHRDECSLKAGTDGPQMKIYDSVLSGCFYQMADGLYGPIRFLRVQQNGTGALH